MYSDTDILKAIERKTIKISSYNENQLGTNSYDVRLGNTFYEVFWDTEGPFFVGPYVYQIGDKVHIPIAGTLLGVTQERIGTSGKMVAELRSRSTARRIGIDPCMAAGMGDIGYNDVWVMEFSAFVCDQSISTFVNPLYGIAEPFLIVGQTIAQMVFTECKSEPTKLYNGQYQVEWPLNMIPKLYRHRIISPKPNV